MPVTSASRNVFQWFIGLFNALFEVFTRGYMWLLNRIVTKQNNVPGGHPVICCRHCLYEPKGFLRLCPE